MSFVNEEVEQGVVDAFRSALGVEKIDTSIEEGVTIHLVGRKQLKDETVDADLTITQTGKDVFLITGSISYSGEGDKQARKIKTDHKGPPEALKETVRKLIMQVRVKKKSGSLLSKLGYS